MANQEETAPTNPNPNPNPNKTALCEQCKSNPSKYKCPGCSVRSCSLPCVKAHKESTGCSGKRRRTEFVPISQFDDNLLLSDYNVLEDVKRVAECAQRIRLKTCGKFHFGLPFHLKSLRNAAGRRRTKILFHSSGMSKRVTNRSYYNGKKNFISWTIEWRFYSTDVLLIDHGVHENTNIRSVIETHLKPGPWNHPLKRFSDELVDNLKFFIRINPKGPRSPFRELDINSPIHQQLANIIILEYPVIHVYLPSHSYNFEVIKTPIPCNTELKKESFSNNYPSPKGVTFKEEEIEETGHLPTRVSDLTKHVKPDPMIQTPHKNLCEREIKETLDRVEMVQDTKTGIENAEEKQANTTTIDLGFLDDMDFVFEQGLLDAYTELMAETNPDSFLDLEGVQNEEFELEERKHYEGLSGAFPTDDELEEGEIRG